MHTNNNVESSFGELKTVMKNSEREMGKMPWKIGRFINFIKTYNADKVKEFVLDIPRSQNSRRNATSIVPQKKTAKKTFFQPSNLFGATSSSKLQK